jgi:hypothetical protein
VGRSAADVRGASSSGDVLGGTEAFTVSGHTFELDVLVYAFLQRFVIFVDLALVLDYVALWCIVGRIHRDDVSLVARVLDILAKEESTHALELDIDSDVPP